MKSIRIKITDRKAFQVSGVLLGEEKTPMISIRQMYTTAKNPEEWLPGRNGIFIEPGDVMRLARALKAFSEVDPSTFKEI